MAFFRKLGNKGASETRHKVLLVDDEPDNLVVLGEILGDEYDVLQASDGQQALDMVRAMDAPEQLALLISDQRMPNLTGVQLCEQVCVVSPYTVCIIVTGYIDVDAIVDSINRTRIFQFVIKPFDRHDFDLTVRRAVEAYEMKRKLDDHMHNLERKVEQRTQELRQRNEELLQAHATATSALEALEKSKAQLVRSEKMAALGQLVEGVAHEINTPVGVGVTAASSLRVSARELSQLFASGKMKKSDLAEFLESTEGTANMILENLGRASALVDTFKSIAVEKSTETKGHFELGPWLEETMASLDWQLAPLDIQVSIACPDGLELVSYSEALFQVINNLVANVIEHAYPPGTRPPGQTGMIRIEAERQGRHVRLVFSDQGAGIAPASLGKIFDPFFTTRRGGGSTGLGLHLVFNLVTGTFKGSIECHSELGEGCQFVMLLLADD